MTEEQEKIIDVATKLQCSYLQGVRSMGKADNPEFWVDIAERLVKKVLD